MGIVLHENNVYNKDYVLFADFFCGIGSKDSQFCEEVLKYVWKTV